METKKIEYQCEGKQFVGYMACKKNGPAQRPGVLVAHAWRGQDDFARHKAEELAELGYIGFAADVYGDGISVNNNDAAAKLMMPLFVDRKILRQRIVAAYTTLCKQPGIDKTRVGAIGFCFGGLTVIELSRSGENLKGIVSFHGVLGDTMSGNKAKLQPTASTRRGAVLILHGHKDPLVSQNDIISIQRELTDAKVDWQMHIYGEAAHAFTNPDAHEIEEGLIYNAKAKNRSWQSMRNFFEEIFV